MGRFCTSHVAIQVPPEELPPNEEDELELDSDADRKGDSWPEISKFEINSSR
jgi:hypothetical protein